MEEELAELKQNPDTLLGPGQKGQVVIFARRHWASFLAQIVLSFLILAIPIVILVVIYTLEKSFFRGIFLNFFVLTISVYYLITITFVFSAWITFYYDLYIVTKDSILDITQQGFFGRKTAQLSLLRVQDVSCEVSGILHTVFGYGDVLVETAGEKVENFLLEAVPNPQRFCSRVMELHDDLIAREGRNNQVAEGEGTFQANNRNHIQPSSPPPISSPPPDIQKNIIPQAPTAESSNNPYGQGEVSKDDLDKGGEVKF